MGSCTKRNNDFKFTFIDLFSGIGGFRLGCEANGGRYVFSSEINGHSCDTYEENFGGRPFGDVTKIDAIDVPDHDLLCAGFPCQAFSMAGKRLGFEDTRGTLIYDIIRILKEKKPKAFILENVAGLLSHDGGRTFYVIRKLLGKNFNLMCEWNVNKDNLGYNVFYRVLNSADFGLAQNRRRIFMVGLDDSVVNWRKFVFPKGDNNKTVISDILEREVDKKYYLSEKEIKKLLSKANRANLKDRMENTAERSGTIIGSYGSIGSFGSSYIDVNKKLGTVLPEFSGKTKLTYGLLSYQLKIPERVVYKKKNSKYIKSIKIHGGKEKSRCITGSYSTSTKDDNDNLLSVRIFTPRECARLQGFPEWFELNKNERQAYKQLGNAVSPPVIEAIVRNIIKVL